MIATEHRIATEQCDPSMGPNERLDIVEYASDADALTVYDVSVVMPLREDAGFRETCAAEPGLAAEQRHAHKLSCASASEAACERVRSSLGWAWPGILLCDQCSLGGTFIRPTRARQRCRAPRGTD